jgi:hypothetical protein
MLEGAKYLMASSFYNRICLFVLFTIVALASFEGNFDKYHLGYRASPLLLRDGSVFRNDLQEILDGTAARPYVYRRLLPDIANYADWLIDRVLPARNKQDKLITQTILPHTLLRVDLVNHPLADFDTASALKYGVRFDVIYWLNLFSALIVIWSMYGICRALDFPEIVSIFASAAMSLLLPYFETGGGYFYDYPEVAFMMLAALAAIRWRLWILLPIAILGAWNKESFVLFIPCLYPLLRIRYSRKLVLWAMAVLSMASASVCILTHTRYASNVGGTVEFHLLEQLRHSLYLPRWITEYEWTYGMPFVRTYVALPLILWTALRGWNGLPKSIHQHAQIAALINVPLFLLFCAPGELRDLSMLYVSFLLLVAASFTKWLESSFLSTKSPVTAGAQNTSAS